MGETSMRRFWDARADDDVLHYIDSRQPYGRADRARFWQDGERDLRALLETAGVGVGESDTIVEVGCGIGRLTRPVAAAARRVIAVDVSERMLALARSENPSLSNVEWLLGDGATLQGIPDACADGCVSWVVFQHIPEPEVILGYVREMGRVLRPGGWAAFQVSTDPSVHRPRGGVRSLVDRVRGRAAPGVTDPAWLGSAVSIAAVRRAAGDGGMSVERTAHEGTQYCVVLARRRASAADPPSEA